jgi:hypothetical protein
MAHEFKVTDFVQVEHIKSIESGEPVTFWRNALYTGFSGGHCVMYTDGVYHALNRQNRIRKARLND